MIEILPKTITIDVPLFWVTVGLFVFSNVLQTGLLYAQQRNGSLSRWWGCRAFTIYNFVTLVPWAAFLVAYLSLHLRPHQLLPCHSGWVQVAGGAIFLLGAVLALWVGKLLGPARLNGVRHFSATADAKGIESGPFRWMDNPMYTGCFLMLLGIGLWKNSLPDLVIALESLILLNHFQSRIENSGLTRRADLNWRNSPLRNRPSRFP
ncbi:MAG: methyltransferase family protein [Dehalococcoidia bacterium]